MKFVFVKKCQPIYTFLQWKKGTKKTFPRVPGTEKTRIPPSKTDSIRKKSSGFFCPTQGPDIKSSTIPLQTTTNTQRQNRAKITTFLQKMLSCISVQDSLGDSKLRPDSMMQTTRWVASLLEWHNSVHPFAHPHRHFIYSKVCVYMKSQVKVVYRRWQKACLFFFSSGDMLQNLIGSFFNLQSKERCLTFKEENLCIQESKASAIIAYLLISSEFCFNWYGNVIVF